MQGPICVGAKFFPYHTPSLTPYNEILSLNLGVKLLGPHPTLAHAVQESFLIGLGFVATTFGINYLFTGTSIKLCLINAGYHVVQFTIFGLVLGLWPA